MGAPWPAASTDDDGAGYAVWQPPSVRSTRRCGRSGRSSRSRSQTFRRRRTPAGRRRDIDRFILARLEREGMAPVAAADKRTLIRRATLDLTGLPPTIEEVEAFEKDTSADAFAKVVDRLLASPQYGETWGRLWLDVARYAEDDPRSLDPMGRGFAPYPNAYLYRDWVIKAFNDDLPVRPVREGADCRGPIRREDPRAAPGRRSDSSASAPGTTTTAPSRSRAPTNATIAWTSSPAGFLGLTVACARCHDHKYDPISARDYYALSGVFLNTVVHRVPAGAEVGRRRVQGAREEDQGQAEAARRVHRDREPPARRNARPAGGEVHARRLEGPGGAEGGRRPRRRASEKLDYELFDRWVKFLAKPPKFYPFLTKWQEMVKAGGSDEEAKTLADDFQALLLDVMFEQREIKEENDIIRAKALPGTKKKEPANLPHEFVTNDDFCPGCGLELKSLRARPHASLVRRRFKHDLQEAAVAAANPGAEARAAGVPRLDARALAWRRPPPLHRRAAQRHRGAPEGAA